ncbi:MAG: Phosphate uptake regulator PhoU [Candidatus Methanohalarchaeum thermophilum]|uniref:Phosphate uptake regulator PhoU n=1 Tax=Methanohalarchaeum thermophilum TaxID=1903181 RepID=A0A1Q6DVW1_METT1|nr:MAG: Phosphate uptake regulator PhoU [Candidatus Methanohalarchaeum thermophilum]
MGTRKLQQKKDGSYQIILPKDMVEGLDWKKSDEIDFSYQSGGLFLKKK